MFQGEGSTQHENHAVQVGHRFLDSDGTDADAVAEQDNQAGIQRECEAEPGQQLA